MIYEKLAILQIIIASTLTIITGFYAIFTYNLVKETRRLAEKPEVIKENLHCNNGGSLETLGNAYGKPVFANCSRGINIDTGETKWVKCGNHLKDTRECKKRIENKMQTHLCILWHDSPSSLF